MAVRPFNDVLPDSRPSGIDGDDHGVVSLGRDGADAPIVRFVNGLVLSAIQSGASDIHVEPYEKELRIRLRVDGVLQPVTAPPLRFRDAITSRVKIMARLDIAEKRLPQDGRIRARVHDRGHARDVDMRVSCLPTLFGEKVVLRVLDPDSLQLDMTRLGLEADALAKFARAIRRPWGMVLVTGPTGSGKTNTLYSALSQINRPDMNAITVEDPVEFNLPGVNQVQVRESIGLTFAAVLRSLLRQDPNVILVGEIRDGETAAIAVKSALTGHLVLSTLHTNDAPGSISRLVNMGIESFLVANSVNVVAAQRLVRRICEHCKTPDTTAAAQLAEAGLHTGAAGITPYRGRGCERCAGTGYKGRIGLFEVMEMSEPLRELVVRNAPVAEMRRTAIAEGMLTLRDSGLQKVRDAITTVEEVIRETI